MGVLQQQMAEGNDHIEYELKMRREEEKVSSPHRKAFKPPRRVSKTPEKREKHRKTPEKKTPEKQSRGSHKEEITHPKRKEKSISPDKKQFFPPSYSPSKKIKSKSEKIETPGKKEKQKIKIRVQVERDDKKPNKSEAKKSKSETADALVKLLVPYFKKGRIASKEVFKITARELTHSLLKRSKQLIKEDYVKFVDQFFD